jgi:mono/diheme cytochrome c family protein
MPSIIRDALITLTFTIAVSIALAAHPAQEHQHPATHPEGGAHRHPAAAALKNPVAADAPSIADGKQVYDKQCAGCHGDTGKGDGAMGEELTPKPANLTDADWKHGSTDGEIYVAIRDGIKNTGMKPYARKITTHQIWDVVNYVRSLAAH